MRNLSLQVVPVTEGLQFVAGPDGKRSSTQSNRAIIRAALSRIDPQTVMALNQEPNWRRNYPRYFRALTAAAITDPTQALTIATDGIAAAWQQVEWVRDGMAMPLIEAMRHPRPATIFTATLRGRGSDTIAPFAIPYRGQWLHGAALHAQIAHWESTGIIEPGCAQALREVMEHPEWLDLSDRVLVLLGAGSEAGPLASLARWRANIIAVDVPDPPRWQRIVELVSAGNAKLFVPVAKPVSADDPPEQWLPVAGVDLLTHAPEVAAWLLSFMQPLDIATLAYLDGERHVRVVLAMDVIVATVRAAHPDTTLMTMATPTDVFAVPEATALAAMTNAAAARPLGKLPATILRALSGGRLLQPHICELITSTNGKRYGIVDCLFLEQGPNYALAKRIQQWRAIIARASGQRVSINVAPSTMTRSVIKNPALRAGYNGAHLFGVEIFAPETTGALMAALWVHDLRCRNCFADPDVAIDHPLELLCAQANHGGLWRNGFLPRTALPLAALGGFIRPAKS
ncbi:MAG: hypothetical protein KatS3mg055_0656 [Chloroflexus sp.]|uniref:hypothetical protein n=1 Tax=Chloroflexus sp. TaxID=1904827 RepID=UPI0021DDD67C|nr:hypothetical protein [Chloroflexus sp.]GIV88138.1 MAG: hypothetical protein KatS3mg055_0656 [Chloroflexus sp.]